MVDKFDDVDSAMSLLNAKIHLHEHDEKLRGTSLLLARIRLSTDRGLFIATGRGIMQAKRSTRRETSWSGGSSTRRPTDKARTPTRSSERNVLAGGLRCDSPCYFERDRRTGIIDVLSLVVRSDRFSALS